MMIGYDIYDCFTMEHFRLCKRMTLTTKIYCSRLYTKIKVHNQYAVVELKNDFKGLANKYPTLNILKVKLMNVITQTVKKWFPLRRYNSKT
jgi:hypothetical protein